MGGIDDKSFNATSWKGIQDAEKQLGVTGKYLESQQQADYAKNVQQLVSEKLDLIVTVGFLLGVDTATAAKANPGLKFAIVDYAYPDCWPGAVVGKDCGSDVAIDNVLGLTFATDEAGFLAGYAAAAATKTGKVATFGGIKLPTVTIFMKGFEAGVKYHNQVKGTKVEVLGWETAKDEGVFAGNFESTDDGKKIAESFVDEGADVDHAGGRAGGVGLGGSLQGEGLHDHRRGLRLVRILAGVQGDLPDQRDEEHGRGRVQRCEGCGRKAPSRAAPTWAPCRTAAWASRRSMISPARSRPPCRASWIRSRRTSSAAGSRSTTSWLPPRPPS